ncbi:Mor transcription activator family protein [Pantoea sp. BAV 3049]|uniref:Mor transcription activator family protein n=1 Tax=Pantoea sp. BAV 3049 TaxID=2654188 RepID=UPI00131CEB2F|nr:Mor transcription activator family protein [Pantoea sp. BAV 3049]
MRDFRLEDLEDLLPDTVRQIVDVIGFDATQKLVGRFGGARFPIGCGTRSAGERRLSLLREVIGDENTRLLVKHFGGEDTLVIPRCAAALREWRNRCFYAEMDNMVNSGESLRMALTLVAPKYGFANTWAWELINRRRNQTPQTQGRLF